MRSSFTRTIAAACAFVALAAVASCGASQQEYQQTYENRQSINEAIPVPAINFSMRRWILAQYYLMNAQPRLPTCSVLLGRGGTADVLAVTPSYGTAVNLSNQMTTGEMSEPDSIYVGPNDQTVVVLRNGGGFVSESDVTTVLGDCPAGVRAETIMQTVIDAESARQTPSVQLLPPA